jgi:hypothetical protein
MPGWSSMRMQSQPDHVAGPELDSPPTAGPRLMRSTTDDEVHVEFGFLGSRFRVTNAPDEVERWLRGCWEASQHPAQSADWLVDVAFSTRAPWNLRPPHSEMQTSLLDGASISWRRHGERWWSTSGADSGLELRIFDDRACIRAWADDVMRSSTLSVHVAICEALRARGLVPLHAAVCVLDGHATAIIGPSGIGKSTTLLSAIEAGWLPLAEDCAWMDPRTQRVHAWAGEHGVRLTYQGLHRVPTRWQLAGWRRQSDGKFFLSFDHIAPSRPLVADLTRVLVLDRDPSRATELEPLRPRDATRALWESAGVPLCRISRAAFTARLPVLLSRIQWARLVLGRGTPAL